MELQKIEDFYNKIPCGIGLIQVNLNSQHQVRDTDLFYTNNTFREKYYSTENNILERYQNDSYPTRKYWEEILYKAAYENQKNVSVELLMPQGQYVSVECFPFEEGICGIMVYDGTQDYVQNNTIKGLSSIYVVLGVINLSKNSWFSISQEQGVNYSQGEVMDYQTIMEKRINCLGKEANTEHLKKVLSLEAIRRNVTKENPVYTYEYERYIEERKKYIWCRLSVIWVSSTEDGETEEVICAVQDINNEKISQIEEKQVLLDVYQMADQESREKTEFIDKMGRNLFLSLNTIVAMIDLTKKSKHNMRRMEQCIERIDNCGKQLIEIVENLLDINRVESGRMVLSEEKINLYHMLQLVMKKLQREICNKKQKITIHCHNVQNPNVYIDLIHIRQVVSSLLKNAIQYTPDGGEIAIILGEEEGVAGPIKGYYVKIIDNGTGIEEENIEKVFEPFFRGTENEEAGAGLGLTIAKSLVELMGGTIVLDSTKDMGTTATVWMRLRMVEEDEEEESKQKASIVSL